MRTAVSSGQPFPIRCSSSWMSTRESARRAASSQLVADSEQAPGSPPDDVQLFVEPAPVDIEDVHLVHRVPSDRPVSRLERIARAKRVPAAWERLGPVTSSSTPLRAARIRVDEPRRISSRQPAKCSSSSRNDSRSGWETEFVAMPRMLATGASYDLSRRLSRGVRRHAPRSPRGARGRFAEGRAPARAREVALRR